jgi:myo-inositol-1(or 4)-monophosphatase
MTSSSQPTLDQVIFWAKKAGEVARDGFYSEHRLGYKGPTDIVTEIDHACEKVIIDAIHSHFPDDAIVAEESGSLSGNSENCWFIDPLDGTVNYSHQLPVYSVSIGYQSHGKMQLAVVYGPNRDECFSAERGKGAWMNNKALHVTSCASLQKALLATGFPHHDMEKFTKNLPLFGFLTRNTQGVRNLGSAALEVCYVALGRIDGYWEQEIHPWDIAASTLIVEEAGGKVTGLDGGSEYFKPPYAIVASAPGIHEELLTTIKSFV